MPKLKTNKSVRKKVKITKNKKVIARYSGQNHYNTRETGNFKRKKRRDKRLFKTDEKNIIKGLPNL
ncbi:MAG: 50S ribosomal protein L35 [Patescibacteria group bacterium]